MADAEGLPENIRRFVRYLKAGPGTKAQTLAAANEAAAELELLATKCASTLGSCFAAGTPLRTPYGAVTIERLRPGDEILSRDEYDPTGPVTAKVVEEVFTHLAQTLEIQVVGRIIRTTMGHPFWVVAKGWVPAQALAVGDRLVGHDNQQVTIEKVVETNQWETVYNLPRCRLPYVLRRLRRVGV